MERFLHFDRDNFTATKLDKLEQGLRTTSLPLEEVVPFPTVPMLHVLAFRPEFEPPWPTRSHMTPIILNRLERPQIEALITHLSGGKALPDDVRQHIVTKTDGVPLYVEELTKMLPESDLLREEADAYVLTGPLLTVAIPDTLHSMIKFFCLDRF